MQAVVVVRVRQHRPVPVAVEGGGGDRGAVRDRRLLLCGLSGPQVTEDQVPVVAGAHRHGVPAQLAGGHRAPCRALVVGTLCRVADNHERPSGGAVCPGWLGGVGDPFAVVILVGAGFGSTLGFPHGAGG